MSSKIVVLGDGLLGTEIVKQTGWDYLSRKKDSIEAEYFSTWAKKLDNYDCITNCMANTNTYGGSKLSHYRVNYMFPLQLVNYCKRMDKKLVHISTDYIYANNPPEERDEDSILSPVRTWYGYTKMLADEAIISSFVNHLILRSSFKPNPFPFEQAFDNMIGNFDYVNVIADLMVQLIKLDIWGVVNVGTELKSMYDLAIRTRPDVEKVTALDVGLMPHNLTMDISKMEKFLGKD